MKLRWLWGGVYKGLAITWDHGQRELWLGWTNHSFKRRGW